MNSKIFIPLLRHLLGRSRPMCSRLHIRVGFAQAFCAMVPFLLTAHRVLAADFAVTFAGNSTYAFNGAGVNPTLTLIRGQTYTFLVTNTPSNHPFRIVNAPAGSTTGNVTFSGTVTFRVPTNAANYTYDCNIHHFGGQILTVPPPTFRIVDLSVGADIVLKSAGTNWNLTPQYSTNLSGTNWFALTVQSNRFINGTNETFCGRPPVSNAFIRISAQRN